MTDRNGLIALFQRQPQRFFAKDMLAGRGRCFDSLQVNRRWRAEVDKVNVWVEHHLVERLVGFDVGQVNLPGGRTKVALNSTPVARSFFGVHFANGHDFDSRQFLIRQEVDPAHEPDASNSNFDHESALGLFWWRRRS